MGLGMAEPYPGVEGCSSASGAGTKRHWLAAYTQARHETSVARQLEAKAVGFLLPTYVRRARWSDRIQRITTPLFPSYVFVHVSEAERARVLQTAGVINIVSVGGKPAQLQDKEVDLLQECVSGAHELEPHPYLKVGQKVRVTQGIFAGWEGILVQKKNSCRLVVTIERIMQSVSVNVEDAEVEAAN